MIDALTLALRAATASDLDAPLRVAVTGHRHLGGDARAFVTQTIDALLAQLQQRHPQGLVALSGIAAGTDTLFAEAALARGIALECCLASEDLIEDFAPGHERERFLALQTRSQRVYTMPYATRSTAAYMALGRWLVDTSDLLIAAWNGLAAAGEGGTGDVVAYARQRGRAVVHIHTLEHTVTVLDSY